MYFFLQFSALFACKKHGGWVLTKHYDIKTGDTVEIDNYLFTVKEMDGHHVKTLEVVKKEPDREEESETADVEEEQLRL